MVESIDKKFICFVIIFFFSFYSHLLAGKINNISTKHGIITLMYHRFDENKYPSTNIQNDIFNKHIIEIEKSQLKFIDAKNLLDKLESKLENTYILLTIDDGYKSFYINAWPILKKRKIPFILFVSTQYVGKKGYMDWNEINEIDSFDFTTIGNHSHTHEYLVDKNQEEIILDIEKSIKLFKQNLGYSPKIFSYPFGEYNQKFKKILKNLGFNFAFGQHSGVIDNSKDLFELPRFALNEKYGKMDRFNLILNSLPFPFAEVFPKNKFIKPENNPPNVKIKFFENLLNIENINCFSNTGNLWKKSEIKFVKEYEIKIDLKEKFTTERGRINCSLRDSKGKWRWLGIQFVVSEY